MPHQITKSWTPDDVARLIELAEGGVTLLRAHQLWDAARRRSRKNPRV